MPRRPKQDPIRKRVIAVLPQVLSKARVRQNISQEDLAHIAEVDRSHMGHLEQGLSDPTITLLFKISKALKLTPSQVVSMVEQEVMGVVVKQLAKKRLELGRHVRYAASKLQR